MDRLYKIYDCGIIPGFRRTIMDISRMFCDLVANLTVKKDLIAIIILDPLSLIKDLLAIDLDLSQMSEVVKTLPVRWMKECSGSWKFSGKDQIQ